MNGNIINSKGVLVGEVAGDAVLGLKGQKLYGSCSRKVRRGPLICRIAKPSRGGFRYRCPRPASL